MSEIGCVIQLRHFGVTGGCTDSVFAGVEAWLAEDSDHWRAFEAIKRRKSDTRYESVLDFLLGETCREWRKPCLAFYAGEGRPLRELVSKREIVVIERRILLFLAIAYASFQQERTLSWRSAVEMVEEILRAA